MQVGPDAVVQFEFGAITKSANHVERQFHTALKVNSIRTGTIHLVKVNCHLQRGDMLPVGKLHWKWRHGAN